MRVKAVFVGASAAAVAGVLGIAAALGAFSSSDAPSVAPATGTRVEAHATLAVLGANGKTVRSARFAVDILPLGTSHAGRAVWGVLSGHDAAGDWDVTLGGTACPASNRGFCQLFEADATASFDAKADAKSLEVSMATAGPGAFKLVLAGKLPVARTGTIGRIATGMQTCPPRSTAGRDCGVFYDPVTDYYLLTPLRVSAGQRLKVRVEIRFGT